MSKTQLCDLHRQCRTVAVLYTVGHAMQVAWNTHAMNNSIYNTLKLKDQEVSNCLSITQQVTYLLQFAICRKFIWTYDSVKTIKLVWKGVICIGAIYTHVDLQIMIEIEYNLSITRYLTYVSTEQLLYDFMYILILFGGNIICVNDILLIMNTNPTLFKFEYTFINSGYSIHHLSG